MSSFDAVSQHLNRKGTDVPPSHDLEEHLRMVVRRCEENPHLGVELSPYVRALMEVPAAAAPKRRTVEVGSLALAAVGV